ncbi:MAG: DUF5666 domain-containing protein [Patescibacteria group bacterium]|nr:DUF5666 domain-containing protein [Patescibacteria group bacterium]MCL5095887.1 DUF5666 domain-containing protein [Patescibacteria group bacterium]
MENQEKTSTKKFWFFLIANFLLIVLAGVSFYLIIKTPLEKSLLPENIKTPLFLSLESPTEKTIVSGDQITVKGKTLPSSAVVFYTETNQGSAQSDVSGQFEGKLTLGKDSSRLTVTAFNDWGEEKTVTFTLASKNKITGVKRMAVYGVITAISENTITVSHPIYPQRTQYSVVVNDKTLIKIKGIETKTMADLKVGLRMAAVGDLNETGLILARRIHLVLD